MLKICSNCKKKKYPIKLCKSCSVKAVAYMRKVTQDAINDKNAKQDKIDELLASME